MDTGFNKRIIIINNNNNKKMPTKKERFRCHACRRRKVRSLLDPFIVRIGYGDNEIKWFCKNEKECKKVSKQK